MQFFVWNLCRNALNWELMKSTKFFAEGNSVNLEHDGASMRS